MTKQRKWLLAALLIPIEVALAVLAWRDLNRRTDDQDQGKKRLWKASVLINPGNSMIYWLFGRC